MNDQDRRKKAEDILKKIMETCKDIDDEDDEI